MASFAVQKFLSFIISHLFIFVFISITLRDLSKKTLVRSVRECFAYALQEFYGVMTFVEVSKLIWVYFWAWYEGVV